ncbi:hypothetical protein [Duganella sp. P38]|uniref:hypothetical protein n=1 Tax=Duganella sp. P38 TaxID=3423949 RepID=UPI003D7B7B7D
MAQIVQDIYRGWEITIRCSGAIARAGQPASYTAIASAELLPGVNPEDWVDSRMQVMNTSGRPFASGKACVAALLAEARQLIDALRR